MNVDIVDKYCTDDNNPIKNLRLKMFKDDVTCFLILGYFLHALKNYIIYPVDTTIVCTENYNTIVIVGIKGYYHLDMVMLIIYI